MLNCSVSGTYMTDVKYAEMDISGSPFCTHVFDPAQVRVGTMCQGIVGKCFKFDRKSLSDVPNCHFVK